MVPLERVELLSTSAFRKQEAQREFRFRPKLEFILW